MEYSKNHKNIVEELLSGKFILAGDKLFLEVKQNEKFYEDFFKFSFGYELICTNDYAVMVSEETNEMLSRDISVFFAILCYELDKDGRNFLDQIMYSEFEIGFINQLFENTSYIEVLRNNKQLKDAESRVNFFNTLSRRNIIQKTGDDKFIFTAAYKIFIDFAQELVKGKIEETN
jgi:hypothetical protein